MTPETPNTTNTQKKTRNKHEVTIEDLKLFFFFFSFPYYRSIKSAADYFGIPWRTLASILHRNGQSLKKLNPICQNDEIAKLSYEYSIDYALKLNPHLTLKRLHTMRYNYRRKNGLNCFLQPCAKQNKQL